MSESFTRNFGILYPDMNAGGYCERNPDAWVKTFDVLRLNVSLRHGNISRDASGCVLAPDERATLWACLRTHVEESAASGARNERLYHVVAILGGDFMDNGVLG